MVGKTSASRSSLPASAIEGALEKDALGMRRAVVPVTGTTVEVVAKRPTKFGKGLGPVQIQIRKMGRGGPRTTSGPARALLACKGKKGCDFAECAREAFKGKLSPTLEVACPTA